LHTTAKKREKQKIIMESNHFTIDMQNSTQASEDMSDFEASGDIVVMVLWAFSELKKIGNTIVGNLSVGS
jgi:hypothetical protein